MIGRALILIVAAVVAPGALAADSPIKIVARPYIDPDLAPVAVDGRMVTVAGAVDGVAVGEDVVIEARRCTRGASFRTVGAATAATGGVFRAQVPAYAGTFFRARLGKFTSAPAAVRWPAPLRVTTGREYGALRIRALVTVTDPPQSFRGRYVELQRQVGERWTRVVRRPLAKVAPFRFRADFTVWVRGMNVRLVIPDASALPCYARAVSATYRS